jgi:hypothetical protein
MNTFSTGRFRKPFSKQQNPGKKKLKINPFGKKDLKTPARS